MTVLHVFDMDGTLLRGTTASVEIARALGHLPALLELEEEFLAGRLTTYGFAVRASEVYADLTVERTAEIFRCCPWLAGIDEVTADIRARGELSAVVTMSPDFFADGLLELGVDEVRASRFPPLPLREPPAESGILVPADKVAIVDALLDRHGLAPDQCVAYGDSASDIPLFGHLRHTVAVNATPALRRVAARSVECADLPTAYRAGRALLDPRLTGAGGVG
jgi:phosphoserine phosphatase